ncbi:MAG: hypothetical protein HQK53_00695 [Oligoflexia bacterium]|nr:hypothetical protein [Oligoflexia bacterium]
MLVLIALLLMLVSCTTYQTPESIDERMARTDAVKVTTGSLPDIPLMSLDFPKAAVGRAPSSVGPVGHVAPAVPGMKSYTNKKIYFLGILDQYEQFKYFLEDNYQTKRPPLEFCPQFHTLYLNYYSYFRATHPGVERAKAEKAPLSSYSMEKNLSTRSKESYFLYPELALPLTVDTSHPNVGEIADANLAQLIFAYKAHLNKLHSEIKELCEYGGSANYYVFENLINHMKGNPTFHRSKVAMQALLKTVLIGNMAIITALEAEFFSGHGPAMDQPPMRKELAQEILSRLDADWAQIYFSELRKRRSAAKPL